MPRFEIDKDMDVQSKLNILFPGEYTARYVKKDPELDSHVDRWLYTYVAQYFVLFDEYRDVLASDLFKDRLFERVKVRYKAANPEGKLTEQELREFYDKQFSTVKTSRLI